MRMREIAGSSAGVHYVLWQAIYPASKRPRKLIERDFNLQFAEVEEGYFEGYHPSQTPSLIVTVSEEAEGSTCAGYIGLYSKSPPMIEDARLKLRQLLKRLPRPQEMGDEMKKFEAELKSRDLSQEDKDYLRGCSEKFGQILH